MAAPAKFLFDVDFAAGSQREPTITLSDHAAKLAEAEAAARQRGYAEGQHDAEVENGRRIASTLERIATGIDHAAKRGSNAKRSRWRSRSRASLRRA
jgi:flagellar assembly protein FliH